MGKDRDDETGRFKERYPRELFIEAVKELETPTTSDIADMVGCSYDLAYRRLKYLAEMGELERAEVGRAFLWSVKER